MQELEIRRLVEINPYRFVGETGLSVAVILQLSDEILGKQNGWFLLGGVTCLFSCNPLPISM
jgi:hypothetical protein